jgi:molybdenum cofactor synthesis domain-containing protein
MEKDINVAVLTISTRCSAGEREDTSGPSICELVVGSFGKVSQYSVLPDDSDMISMELQRICDRGIADVVFTLGGTGLSSSDVTPEATERVIEKKVPGISETIRRMSLEKTPRAMLSRGICGIRKGTLIINMPGSEKAVRESFSIVHEVLEHAVELIRGEVKDCGRSADE